ARRADRQRLCGGPRRGGPGPVRAADLGRNAPFAARSAGADPPFARLLDELGKRTSGAPPGEANGYRLRPWLESERRYLLQRPAPAGFLFGRAERSSAS